ncbi:MAG: hypothetical protein GWN01_08955 [Nitrosopumilaceae archaeon]|nr:thermonuclease family protein [Nitrosopumilaceae archaeon]NIU01037.1 thermonuclease family protein [Nitrosopumilaceae archaeon]NIU87471.1 hypothetical protein [Nitrosopumilaceae archaeon]NIV65520.1 hypothetical protein [Nitrosopumilaceae archaeon]NIX61639.1 hypothetical protein [Nitrosopumilaceae archaeon]
MRNTVLVILAIIAGIGILTLLAVNHSSDESFVFCEKGYVIQGDKCVPETNVVPPDEKSTSFDTSSTASFDMPLNCQGDRLCLTEEVTRIIDGDTLYLKGGYKIRLSLTNTPERHETGFHEASQFTSSTCPVGSKVTVDQDDLQPYDVYNRLLGKVICGNKILNAELLYHNHADILDRYCPTSEFSDEKWAQEFGC